MQVFANFVHLFNSIDLTHAALLVVALAFYVIILVIHACCNKK